MNHSCENTSLQNVSVENLQFPERSVTVVGSEGWQRTAFPVLSCITVWRTFGTNEDTRTVGRSLLLDRHGG